jgi:hypothetical protein
VRSPVQSPGFAESGNAESGGTDPAGLKLWP